MKWTYRALYTLLFFSLVWIAKPTLAQTCSSNDECKNLIKEYEQKLSDTRVKKNTLSSEIQFMDTQIYLNQLRVQNTEAQVKTTQEEIENLEGRIGGFDRSLDFLTKVLLQKIVEGYKRKQEVNFLQLILEADNASTLVNRLKYVQVTQSEDSKLTFQVQEAKQNAEKQKNQREKKKLELDQLQLDLEKQKIDLDNQKTAKQRLLADTQNSEAVYQSILSRARAQLSGFSSFARSSGVFSSVGAGSLGSGSDGNYFSQRDSRWSSQIIGNSSSDCNGHPCSVLEAGCLVSSVAMASKKKGIGLDPGAIASNPNYFSANTAYMKFGLPSGLSRHQIGLSDVDSQLQQGNYVIAGINYGGCSSNSDHFVVLISGSSGNYTMHDPLYGPDLPFSSHYSQVCWAEVLN